MDFGSEDKYKICIEALRRIVFDKTAHDADCDCDRNDPADIAKEALKKCKELGPWGISYE